MLGVGGGELRLRLTLDGERLAACEPVVGFVHRGAEKLFEVRDYRQIIVLANRHDWLAAFSSELGVVLAVERMLGLEVPERAVWARTLLAELNRILSHLAFLGACPVGSQVRAASDEAFRAREAMQSVMEQVSGGRLHYMFNRVGGLKEDLPAGWLSRVVEACDGAQHRLARLGRLVLAEDLVDEYGVSGPVARASGCDFDLRRDEPYLAYGQLSDVLRVPTRSAGDAWSRLAVLHEQALVSLDLVRACAGRLGTSSPGPVNVPLPKVLRVPEGATYAWTENPLGVNGYYLVSRGDRTPWRMKLRSASFNNVAALPEVVVGCRVADLAPVLASLFLVAGDMDK